MAKVITPSKDGAKPSHNLLGQRLGRKGRDTRERILAATEKLLSNDEEPAVSLSAVAREASLGMTTLYLYFNDLSELLLAVLDRVMAAAEEAYVGYLRTRWPEDRLGQRCQQFVEAYYRFWVGHARIMQLRNSYIEGGDQRMREHRVAVMRPVIELLIAQMDDEGLDPRKPAYAMAATLLTGLERIIGVATDETFKRHTEEAALQARNLMMAQARLFELGIRDCRAQARRRPS